jgi:hypothetical protein
MLEFLKKFFISVRVRIPYCRAAASVLRVIGFLQIFNARDKKNRTSASKDVDVLLIKFPVSSKFSKSRSSSPLPASP